MPPLLNEFSEDESAGEEIPFNDPKKADEVKNENEEDESGDEDDDEEDMYVVEKIVGHEFGKGGKVLYQVKWKGYDKPEDQTLEPEENLETAKEVLDEYFKVVGGRPEKPTKKRKSMGAAASTPDRTPAKKARKSLGDSMNGTPEVEKAAPEWIPKGKNWDKEVQVVETIVRQDDNNLYALLHWNNGKKSKVSIQQCYEKCPQKMLQFYEQHLVFKEGE